MLLRRTTRTLTSWVACLAILMSVLAPTLSLAFGSSAMDWSQICSTTNTTADATLSRDSRQPTPVAHVFEHCPYCSLHGHLAGLPPAPLDIDVLLPLSFEAPALFFSAPRTLHAWVVAQPRAPPAFS